MPMTPKKMIRLLKKNGFVIKSQCGSHLKMYNKKNNITVIIPIHARELKKGMESAILRDAQIERGEKQ